MWRAATRSSSKAAARGCSRARLGGSAVNHSRATPLSIPTYSTAPTAVATNLLSRSWGRDSPLAGLRLFHQMPQLPHIDEPSSLSACFSPEAFSLHIKKHHLPHLQAVNKLIQGTGMEDLSLEELIHKTKKDKEKIHIYHHASEAWNHNFFLQCMSSRATEPDADLLSLFDLHFGGFEHFKKKFEAVAKVQLGSGWTWLVDREGHLELVNTSNTGCVIIDPQTAPLLVLDVWEHAYYLDFRDNRSEYVRHWWNVVNWNFVATKAREASAARASSDEPLSGLKAYF